MKFPSNPTNEQVAVINGKSYTYNQDVDAWLVEGSSDPLVVTEYTYDYLPDGVKRSILMKDLGVDRAWDNIRNTRDSKISAVRETIETKGE